MNFGFLEEKEKEVEKSINWEDFQARLNSSGFELEEKLRKFLSSFEIRGLKDDLIPNVLKGFYQSSELNKSTIDSEIRYHLKAMSEIESSFYILGDGEEEISKLALKLFQAFHQTLIESSSNEDRALIIAKLIYFSSPTEMAVTLMTHYSELDPKLAVLIGDGLVKKVDSIYKFHYKENLTPMEKFQVMAPFLRTMAFKEQMQVAIIIASALREKLMEQDPQLWLDISPLFKLCLMRHAKNLELNSLSEEDKNRVSDSSIKDAFAEHQDIAMDLDVEIQNMPSIIFRRYQDRTAERVSKEYLALFREFTEVLPKIKDAHIVIRMLRYIQDYVLLELSSINANCLLVSELTTKSFSEQLVITIDMLREAVALNSDSDVEVSCFDNFIRYDLLPEVLAEGDLVKYVDIHIPGMAIKQMEIFGSLLALYGDWKVEEVKFISQFACDSPYRFLSVMNWVDFSDIQGDIEIQVNNLDNSRSDHLFMQAMMLSWVIFKEFSYNKLLVGERA